MTTPDPKPETLGPRHITVVGVQWIQIFEFLHLFRGFRLAINPAKIGVALLALVLMYASGRLFDAIWGPQVAPSEIEFYQRARTPVYRDSLDRWRQDLRERQLRQDRQDALRNMLESAASYQAPPLTPEDQRYYAEHPRAAHGVLQALYISQFRAEVARAAAERADIERQLAGNPAALAALNRNGRSPADIEAQEKQRAALNLQNRMTAAEDVVGRGIFAAFLKYELRQCDALVENTLSFVRFAPLRPRPGAGLTDLSLTDNQALTTGLVSPNPDRLWRSDTIVGSLANLCLTGPGWLFAGAAPMNWRPTAADGAAPTWGQWVYMLSYRGLYLLSLLILLAFWLSLIALAGGLICRCSALEFAGRNDAPLPQVFAFVRRRFGHFVRAPLLPLAMLAVLGLALMALGFVGAIPFVGELLLGLGFVLFLAGGFVLMLLLLATLGGFHLLYPAIAVDGADSFDAVSRSFAYVYARPWRLLTYTVINLLYGAVTFLFIALAAYLVLALTHLCVGWGTDWFGTNHAWFAGGPKLEALWPSPEFGRLIHPTNWGALSWTEWLGALMLQFWVFLVAGAVAAYAVSFYFSSHTIVYFLLRRSADGPSLSEVYEPSAPATPSATPPASAAPPSASPAPAPVP